MAISEDVMRQIEHDFTPSEIASVISRLESVETSDRVIRCIVFASRGHPWYFEFLCKEAENDSRNVIMAAEYERLGTRLYEFNHPIPEVRMDR